MKTHAWLAGALALSLAGCNQSLPDPQPITERVELQAFSSCEELEAYIEDTAVLEMRAEIERLKADRERNSRSVLGGAEDAAANSAPPMTTSPGPSAYTTTNVQVAGVDEADFVKNDGTRIFVLSGQRLFSTRSWPAESMSLAGSLQIEGVPREMFLDGDRVVVFSTAYSDYGYLPEAGALCAGDKWGCDHEQPNLTKITVVDASDLSAPKVVREEYLAGAYVSARRIGGSVRVVVADQFRQPAGIRLEPELEEGLYEQDKARFASACADLIEQNEELIRARSLSDWMPPGKRRIGERELEVGYQCTDFRRANAPTLLGVVTVATLNLDADLPVQRTSVMGKAEEIYASPEALYVAHRHWWLWPQEGQRDWTYLHKFDLSDPERAPYLASGGVEGHIVDQFSLDERNGYLRVASNATTYEDDLPENRCGCMGAFNVNRTSRVTVLSERSGALTPVGRSEDLAKGERLMAARFLGERAYLVTFRQVDPLFTLDLSNPAAPRVTGELKIPGFSTYLHPIDDGHLLAIGATGAGWGASGVKLSVFDVRDAAAPKELWWANVGEHTYSGQSEAQSDHRAFNYFPERKLLAIPFFDYAGSLVSDLRVFTIDLDKGILPRGVLDMSGLYTSSGVGYSWDWSWQPGVRRSVMADDYVYAICDGGIRAARVGSLDQPVSEVRFER